MCLIFYGGLSSLRREWNSERGVVMLWFIAIVFAVMIYVGTFTHDLIVAYGAAAGFLLTCGAIFFKLTEWPKGR